jgi:hypothetical protein
MGVKQPMVSKIESLDRDLRFSTILSACRALGIEELRISIPPLGA